MEHIHRIVYINLERRTDRRQQLERELQTLQIPAAKIERFPAIVRENGLVGCAESHLAVLQRAQAEGWPNVLVLEDDFLPAVGADQWQERLQQFVDDVPDYDVLLLAYSLTQAQPHAARGAEKTLEAQTTAGYLVHSRFYDKLLANLAAGLHALQQTPHRHLEFGLDMYWKRLQPAAQWFHLTPRLGTQRAGYSDIEHKHVDYGV
jgi:glycosyl transferase family 25